MTAKMMAALGLLWLIISTVTVLVKSEDTSDSTIYPAKLYGAKAHVRKGETLELKCSTTGLARHWDKVHVYLNKNGAAIQMKALEKEEGITFTIKEASLKDSGNYSCVYTKDKLQLSQINSQGDNLVVIQFLDNGANETVSNPGKEAGTHVVLITLVLLVLVLVVLLLLWKYSGFLKHVIISQHRVSGIQHTDPMYYEVGAGQATVNQTEQSNGDPLDIVDEDYSVIGHKGRKQLDKQSSGDPLDIVDADYSVIEHKGQKQSVKKRKSWGNSDSQGDMAPGVYQDPTGLCSTDSDINQVATNTRSIAEGGAPLYSVVNFKGPKSEQRAETAAQAKVLKASEERGQQNPIYATVMKSK